MRSPDAWTSLSDTEEQERIGQLMKRIEEISERISNSFVPLPADDQLVREFEAMLAQKREKDEVLELLASSREQENAKNSVPNKVEDGQNDKSN
jgi:predicted Fe-S protein YdhL (DUF1289 family)